MDTKTTTNINTPGENQAIITAARELGAVDEALKKTADETTLPVLCGKPETI